jgi:hypothetical protein
MVKIVDFKPFDPHCCGFQSHQGFCSCEKTLASLQNVSGSTQVPFGPEIIYIWAQSTNKAGNSQYDMYCIGAISNPTKKGLSEKRNF